MRQVLITSGAYVNQEMVAEFGALPPAFLPAGSRRLYERQIAWIGEAEIWLSLPDSFDIPALDLEQLAALHASVQPVPAGLRLGQSIAAVLEARGVEGPLEILHGDTLIGGAAAIGSDAWSIGQSAQGYPWAHVDLADGQVRDVRSRAAATGSGGQVLTGYFAFADALLLRRCLVKTGHDFIGALRLYAGEREVKGHRPPDWYDFGHLQTYYRSRKHLAAARAFNTLQVTETTVRKSSEDEAKLRAEAEWFARLPADLRPYGARLIEISDGPPFSYATEYEFIPTLSELYVFGQLKPKSWERIFAACAEFLTLAARHEAGPGGRADLIRLVVGKTRDRLEQFARSTGFPIDREIRLNGRPAASLTRAAEEVEAVLSDAPDRVRTVMHGDYCFSNILYDSRSERIRLIDPRGSIDGETPTIYGDQRYDLAKLAHSVLGGYDEILAGRRRFTRLGERELELSLPDAPQREWVRGCFRTACLLDADADLVAAAMVSLFLSMLPLHADDPERQLALLANALRLHRRHLAGAA